jgi:hypothetical protein
LCGAGQGRHGPSAALCCGFRNGTAPLGGGGGGGGTQAAWEKARRIGRKERAGDSVVCTD